MCSRRSAVSLPTSCLYRAPSAREATRFRSAAARLAARYSLLPVRYFGPQDTFERHVRDRRQMWQWRSRVDHGLSGSAFTNAYTGTFTSFPSGNSVEATGSPTQSPTPELGLFGLTATATFVNSTCVSSGTSGYGGVVLGRHIGILLDTNDGGRMFFDGNLTDSSGKTIAGRYQVLSGTCAGDFGTTILTRQ